jgi:PAS domain S-box-containing protein
MTPSVADATAILRPASRGGMHPAFAVFASGTTEHREHFTIVRKDGERATLRLSIAPLIVVGHVAGAIVSFNKSSVERRSKPSEFTISPFDALLEIASAGERDDLPFEATSEALLESLIVATGADRAVLMITERLDGENGNVLIEAPAGSEPLGPDHPLGGTKRPTKAGRKRKRTIPVLGDGGVQSLVALPLKISDHVVGMLSVVSAKKDYFDRDRVRMLTAAVDRLTRAYDRREWLNESERLTVSSEVMFSAAHVMSSHGGFDEKASALLRLATRTLGGSTGALVGPERAGTGNTWLAGGPAIAPGQTAPSLQPEAIAHSIVGTAQARKAITPSREVAKDSLVLALDPDAVSAVAAPVIAADEVVGVMLIPGQIDRPYPPEQLRLVGAIAEHLGALLTAARQGNQLNASLQREYARLGAVKSAAEQLGLVDSPDQALRHLVNATKELVGARFGGIAVWGLSGNVKTLITSGSPGSTDPGSNPDPDPDPEIVNDILGLIRFALVQERKSAIRVNESPFTDSDEGLGVASLLGVPFTCTDGSSGGFFLVDKDGSGQFNAEDERLISLFSAMASVLLDNIRLYNAEECERRTLTAIHGSMAEGLLVLDDDGQIVFSNVAAQNLLGAAQAEIKGKSFRAWLLRSPQRFAEPETATDLAAFIERAKPGVIEVSLAGVVNRDLAVSLFAIDASQGERLSAVLLRDVTQEREHERRRDTFVSIASHELRTPMTTVMGFTELLRSEKQTNERHTGWLNHIFEDSNRVLEIVDDLLDVSRIQSGNLSLSTHAIDLADTLNDIAEKMRPTTDRHALIVDVPADLPSVLADEGKLTQVLLNLISNAIKYSPKGERITLSATHAPEPQQLIVSVTDQGIGIAQQDQARLFNTFQRINKAETAGIRGTGLGLYIVKGLVELMNGEIWIESTPGEGSTFHVAFPEANQAERAA